MPKNPHGKQFQDKSIAGGKIEDSGIDTLQLATDAVTPAKIDKAQTYDFSAGDVQVKDIPTGDSSTVNKKYVDDQLNGLHPKQTCALATAATLPSYTMGGPAGVGRTLTIDATGVFPVDGVNVLLNDRVIVKNENGAQGSEGAHVDHGIYKCTTEGEVGVQAVLTRAEDFDGSPGGEVEHGDYAWVATGTANADSQWTLITPDVITVDTTAIQFTQTSGAGQIDAGDGLTKSGNILNVGEKDGTGAGAQGGAIKANADDIEVVVDDSSIEITDVLDDPGVVQVKAAGITESHLNTSVAGNGISGGGGSKLTVVPDATGSANVAKAINVDANGVGVKIDNDTVKANGSDQLKAATPTVGDKDLPVSTTAGDNQPTGVTISKTPAGDRAVNVFVNGIKVELGGDLTKHCFFADPGTPTVPVAISAIKANDVLRWMGVVAGYDLNATTDSISLVYDTAA